MKNSNDIFHFISQQNELIIKMEVTLARIEVSQDYLIKKLDDVALRQKEHEEKDDVRFNNLSQYAASIATIGTAIGACGTYIWGKLTGKI